MGNIPFQPHHMNANALDLTGNNGIGRYVIIPGSDGRAKGIAEHFDDLIIKPHSRGHNLYLGSFSTDGKKIDVAAISSGMGCPSMEIILHELFHLGAKRFLRVGTAGSLQPDLVKVGDIVNAQASVRDESTTLDYQPIAIPAIASLEYTLAIQQAAKNLGLFNQFHSGIVHCKSSLYAREFGAGPSAEANHAYLNLLTDCGVLASEMESAALFVQSQLYNYQLRKKGSGPSYKVICGSILSIVTMSKKFFVPPEQEASMEKKLISLAFESIKILSKNEN